MADARVVGIDLGTTNTLVAFADDARAITILPIAQLVAPGSEEARPLFPSCLYAPLEGERLSDPFGDAPYVAGELARRRGAEVPGRLVASAKSWLCHTGVDRTAPILPWGSPDGTPDLPKISPIDASARYLAHVRRVYNARFPDLPLEQSDVTLTVPASFDEVARELTLEAATRAGLTVRLLEEPTAAFYDYLLREGSPAVHALAGAHGGEAFVLVVDVGGGTTDLSLLRVTKTEIERVAVGQHLLLGGDNMDLALAAACEARLGKLDAGRFGQLVAQCRVAKERLLGARAPKEVEISLLGKGAKLVGAAMRTKLAREEAERIVLDGFFPETARDAKPERTRSALVAFGLPYEKDVAITRHVAHFFDRHAPKGAHPHALLVNGGVFRGKRVIERLAAAIEGWGGPKLRVLPQPDPDLGVARGAVAYGLSLRGALERIGGGSARGFYVGVDGGAVCVVPRGAKEGVVHRAASRTLALTLGRPVRFDLYASDDARTDAPGDVVPIDEERMMRLPPIAAALASGEKAREVQVVLEGELTAVGTLDLACVELAGKPPRRHRLAFQLRRAASEGPAARVTLPPPSIAPVSRSFEGATAAIVHAFGKPLGDAGDGSVRDAKDLVRELERLLGPRASWTTEAARGLFDALVAHRRARRRSLEHERVFWMLAGYCVRPGFGDPLDPQRVAALVPLWAERLAFPEEARGWAQYWIAWRRIAGGLDDGTQAMIRETVDPYLAPTEAGLKRNKKFKPEAMGELLEMASSLERAGATSRAALGEWVLERTWVDDDPRLWAAIGRIGARVPAYASLHHVVAVSVVERWLDTMMRAKWTAPIADAAARLARKTNDRARDVGERVRREVEKKLTTAGADPDLIKAVREHVEVAEVERAVWLGDGLPVGLRLVT